VDKGRALFTWLHLNIDYDTNAFFNDNVRGSTPQSTLQSGLAVCEGYAGLFHAMARGAGIESLVVGGHGKGSY
jgi:transglutaminase/protease-like cytokinesis protein 3